MSPMGRVLLLMTVAFVLASPCAFGQDGGARGRSEQSDAGKKEGREKGEDENGLTKAVGRFFGFLGGRVDQLGKSAEAVAKGMIQLAEDAIGKKPGKDQAGKKADKVQAKDKRTE